MWKIWKEEFYKIASRRTVWLGLFLLLAFVSFRLYSECNTYTAVIGGKVLRGREAIRKDQELTRLYAGDLTLDKISQIYEEYGFFYYDMDDKTRMGNFCNQFITMRFTNYMQTDGNAPEDIHFLEGREWEGHAARLKDSPPRFDYIYGWDDFSEMYITCLIVVFILLIIGLAPIFAEEYQLKTADILRTTRRGKKSGIWMKILAAISFSAILTCGVSAYLAGIYLTAYGTQGLDASAILLTNLTSYYGYCPETILMTFIMIALLGLISSVLLAALVSCISALCKSPFPALVISLAGFLAPVLWVKILAPMQILGVTLTRMVSHFMVSMPVYLPVSTGFAFSKEQIVLHLYIALAAGTCGILLGYRRYRNA